MCLKKITKKGAIGRKDETKLLLIDGIIFNHKIELRNY